MASLRPDLEFFVGNYRDIAAVLEINERARAELPDQLAELLLEEIKADFGKKENGWNGIFYARIMEPGVVWCDRDRLYDLRNNRGMDFGLGPFSEDTILDAGGPQDGPFLFFTVVPWGNKAQQTARVEAVRKVITANRSSLQIPGVSFGPLPDHVPDHEDCLAYQSMFDLLTLDKLHKDERARTMEQIVERGRKFSEAIAPILPPLSDLEVVSAPRPINVSAPRPKKGK